MSKSFITELNTNLASLGLQQEEEPSGPESASSESVSMRRTTTRNRLGSQSASVTTSSATTAVTTTFPEGDECDAEDEEADSAFAVDLGPDGGSATNSPSKQDSGDNLDALAHAGAFPQSSHSSTGLPNKHQYFSTYKDDLDIVAFNDPSEYLDSLKLHGIDHGTTRSWRLNPFLGPTAQLIATQQADEAIRRANAANTLTTCTPYKNNSIMRMWLAQFGRDSQGVKRVELLLTKVATAGPVLIGAAFDLNTISAEAIAVRVDMLAAKVKLLMPSAIVTPGGSLRQTLSNPHANIYAVYGPAAVSQPFAHAYSKLVADMSPSALSQIDSPIKAGLYRTRKLKLTHLPSSHNPPPLGLGEGFAVRKATLADDAKAIAKLLKDYKEETAFKPGGFTSFDACLKEVNEHIRRGTILIYAVTSKTCKDLCLIAGYLTLGSPTSKTAAITSVFTHQDFRDRNVGESLVRTATNMLFEDPKLCNLVCLVPDLQETAARLFGRIGYRILDRSRWESTSEGEEDGVKIRRSLTTEATQTYLSWERWLECRFDGVLGGVSWPAI